MTTFCSVLANELINERSFFLLADDGESDDEDEFEDENGAWKKRRREEEETASNISLSSSSSSSEGADFDGKKATCQGEKVLIGPNSAAVVSLIWAPRIANDSRYL